jgi:hypothetical protein
LPDLPDIERPFCDRRAARAANAESSMKARDPLAARRTSAFAHRRRIDTADTGRVPPCRQAPANIAVDCRRPPFFRV